MVFGDDLRPADTKRTIPVMKSRHPRVKHTAGTMELVIDRAIAMLVWKDLAAAGSTLPDCSPAMREDKEGTCTID